jgi:CO dehydrogenase/acetyl-CoA synthase beta subunit
MIQLTKSAIELANNAVKEDVSLKTVGDAIINAMNQNLQFIETMKSTATSNLRRLEDEARKARSDQKAMDRAPK